MQSTGDISVFFFTPKGKHSSYKKQTKTDAAMKKSGNSKSHIKTKAVGIWALVQKVMGGVMSYLLNLH